SAAVSDVTGSHSDKVGFEERWASARQSNPYNSDLYARYTVNTAPLLAVVTNGQSLNIQKNHADGGAFVQDQWKLQRFTINLGLRWDHFNAGVPAQTNPAGYFTQAASTHELTATPIFIDCATSTEMAWE